MSLDSHDRKIINDITFIRMTNNTFWMKIVEIALESAPQTTKLILAEINANDRKISDLLGELAK